MVKLVVLSPVDAMGLVAVVVKKLFGTTGPPSCLVQLGPRAVSPDPLVELVMLALVAAVELIAIFVMGLLVKLVALVPAMLVTQSMFGVRKHSVKQLCLTHLLSPYKISKPRTQDKMVLVPVFEKVTVVLMILTVVLVAATILIASSSMAVESQPRSRP